MTLTPDFSAGVRKMGDREMRPEEGFILKY